MLRETDTVRVMLRDTLLVLVSDAATEGEALNEHDLNNGLQERVTLTVGGLLLEVLRLAEKDGDTLFDA